MSGRHKKLTFPLIIAVSLTVLVFAVWGQMSSSREIPELASLPRCQIRFANDRVIDGWIAESQEARYEGLWHVERMDYGQGLLFVFPRPQTLSMWMPPEMKLEIDMIFLDDRKRVIHVEKRLSACKQEPCPNYGPPGIFMGRYVIEVVAGFSDAENVGIGDQIEIIQAPGQ